MESYMIANGGQAITCVPIYGLRKGLRKTAYLFGAVAVDNAAFVYQFADVFNGHTFREFLLTVVESHAPGSLCGNEAPIAVSWPAARQFRSLRS